MILAEKPSQAKTYAEAFSVKHKSKTHIEIESCATFKSGAFITWGIGHLVELKLPQETQPAVNTWDLKNLPYLPEHFEYKVAKGKTEQFNAVKRLLKSATLIINACDVDREGSNSATRF
ncbi:toprim domain-containing protein [Salinicoccus albus]|uniref:toprim domain-containing protein n=1 Tax=Salinicoccus albus TaxID=418756 RepID=UPI001FDEDF5D|nr:toprim domain-containing protein [Salinicoccus albus]